MVVSTDGKGNLPIANPTLFAEMLVGVAKILDIDILKNSLITY